MLGHGAEDLLVGRGVAEAKGLVLRLAAADDVDGADAEEPHDAAQLVDGERLAEVLAHRQLDAGVADELERRAALAAAGVVEEEVGHGGKDSAPAG